MKTGLLGGTFNPIHIGHLIIAEWIRHELSLEKVFFIPTAVPPHKPDSGIIDASHRFEMVKIALKDDPHFEVSDFEMINESSYSINTINYFLEKFNLSKKDLFFIIGEDNLAQLDMWRSPEKIINMCTLTVVPRNFDEFKEKLDSENEIFKDIVLIKFPKLDISSTIIRDRLKMGKSVKYLVPAEVEKYIINNGLYI